MSTIAKPVTYTFQKNSILLILTLLPICLFSQLSVTNNNNAQAIAQSIVGTGITINNATLNGGALATALFNYTGNHLGLSEGILLTTGNADEAGKNGAYFCNVANNNNFSDNDLLNLDSKAKYDVCILEFDFVPICDSLRIKYVFGSEEYPKSINSAYNDAFGIFLTGANPAGGTYQSKNIALLPNGYTPVSIDSVNGGWPIGQGASHPQYYVDNYTSPLNDIAYNGYTIPVSSKAALVPCTSYHIKIAIADGSNSLYDSGVFIQGNSLACNFPEMSINVAASCSNSRTLSLNLGNYSGTPSYTWLPGGENTSSIFNASAGNYTCLVYLPNTCADVTLTTIVLPASTLSLNQNEFFICKGQSVQLNANGANTYSWFPSLGLNKNDISNPLASPSVSTIYSVTGTSSLGCTSSKTVMIHLPITPVIANFSLSSYEVVIDDEIQFSNLSSGASSWQWDFYDNTHSSEQNPKHYFSIPGTYSVTLTANDDKYCSNSITKQIIVNDIIKNLFTFYIPNVFSPNGDHINDTFFPRGVAWDEKKFTFIIYDRWGEIVYTSNNCHEAWDGSVKGTLGEEAIYFWTVELTDIFKTRHFYSGTVLLLK